MGLVYYTSPKSVLSVYDGSSWQLSKFGSYGLKNQTENKQRAIKKGRRAMILVQCTSP